MPYTAQVQFKRPEDRFNRRVLSIGIRNMTDPDCFWEGYGLRGGNDGGAGCFREGTLIRMADGRQRKVEELRPGDEVLRPLSNLPARITEVVAGPESTPLFLIKHTKGEIIVTATHPLLTRNGIKQAQHLRLGDMLQQADGSRTRITAISRQATSRFDRVWNFAVEPLEDLDYRGLVVEADGLVSGDLTMQRKLER